MLQGRKLLALLALALAGAAHAQTHVLTYTPPANSFRSGLGENFELNGTGAHVQVYQFQEFQGDIVQTFQSTLLRDWISPMMQEENAAKPVFQRFNMPGADLVIGASFNENRVGIPRPHLRMLIIAGKEAAIFDATANDPRGWQLAVPRLKQMAESLRVEGQAPLTPLTSEAANSIAGLYMGTKLKYMASMVNVIGSGYSTQALHFYLFSPDGQVYRAYDKLETPGGRFDFAGAARRDPMNVGHYTVDQGKLVIKINKLNPETIVTDPPKDGRLVINSIPYQRQ
jgi:hypothetical protein